jgi:hypothetical protein
MKLYCFYTTSHNILYEEWLKPSASREYLVIPKEHPQLSQNGSYSDSGWVETQYQKVLFWIECVEENLGDVIVCSDVDVQFFGATKELLIECLGDRDICFQQNDEHKSICSGFFICRCSRNTLDFLKIIANRLKRKFGKSSSGEQVEINKLLSEKWYKNLQWSLLPRNKFWNHGSAYDSVEDLNPPKYLLVHHANWCSGVEAKIDQLEFIKMKRSKNIDFWKPIVFQSSSKGEEKLRIAICLSSLLRSFEIASTSLIVRLVKSLPCKPDLIGHFPIHCKSRKHIKRLNELEPFFNKINITFESDPEIPMEELLMLENMTDQPNGIRGNLLQWLSMKNCAKMLESRELHLGRKYDWVIWSRPDLYFFNSLDNILLLNNEKLYLPCHDNHLNGLNDRFCMGSSDLVKQRMHIYDYFIKEWYPNNRNNIKLLTWSDNKNQYVWNPELVLKAYLDKLNIKPHKINLCFGKLRDNFFATSPFWNSIHGSLKQSNSFDNDVINYEVLNKINTMEHCELIRGSDWHAVNVLQDSSLLYRYSQSIPIESKMSKNTENKNTLLNKFWARIFPRDHQ